jgi:AraC-like DNA-binding protein
MSFYRFLFFLELLNGLVLIAALLSRKDNRRANLFLCGVIGAVLYSEWVRFLIVTEEIRRFPFFLRTTFPAALLVPALFYLYCLALTVPNFRWKPKLNLHFLPFLGGLLWYAFILIFGRRYGFWDWPRRYPIERYLLTVISVIVYAAYLVACFLQLRRYQAHLKDYFSELRRVRLLWLRVLLGLLTLPWIVGLVDVVTGPYVTVEQWMIPVVALVILLIGFWGFRQSAIFAPDDEWEESKAAPPSFFSPDELDQRKKQLERYVQEQRPYLNPELRLVDLARGLKLKPYQVSEILNRGMATSFYELMNRLRVQEVQQKLVDPSFSHYNLLGIAMESGFNSKSVFNDVFRKNTGMTPSVYRKSRQSEELHPSH